MEEELNHDLDSLNNVAERLSRLSAIRSTEIDKHNLRLGSLVAKSDTVDDQSATHRVRLSEISDQRSLRFEETFRESIYRLRPAPPESRPRPVRCSSGEK